MRTIWHRWVILAVISALLFSILAAQAAFGAVLPGGAGSAAQLEEEAEETDGEEGEEPEEPKSPEEVLEKVLTRIAAAFQKCLDSLNRAMGEAAEQAREALELAISNVERIRDWLAEGGLPPFKEGPFPERPQPGDRDDNEGDEEADGGMPDVETPVPPKPPETDELPVAPPVPWMEDERSPDPGIPPRS